MVKDCFDRAKKTIPLFKVLLHIMDSQNMPEGEQKRGAIVHLCGPMGRVLKCSELCDSPGSEFTRHPYCGFTIVKLKKPGPFGEMIDCRAGTEKIQSEPRAP